MSVAKAHEEGVLVTTRVTPKVSRNAADGVRCDADGNERLVLKVTAPPDKGKANNAVIKLLAKALNVPASQIEIVSGETNRNKTLLVRGESGDLLKSLNALTGNNNND